MKGLIFSLAVLTSISFVAESKSQQSSGKSSNVKSSEKRLNLQNEPIDLRALGRDEQINLCISLCGQEYSFNTVVREFDQLRKYPDPVNHAGLICLKKFEPSTKDTPCHLRKPFIGIHSNGLAKTKTEIHRGAMASSQGGAWCVAYNEDDFPGMKVAINFGLFKPGQVACMSGIKLDSLKK